MVDFTPPNANTLTCEAIQRLGIQLYQLLFSGLSTRNCLLERFSVTLGAAKLVMSTRPVGQRRRTQEDRRLGDRKVPNTGVPTIDDRNRSLTGGPRRGFEAR
jgi:hypothetical protein